MYDGKFWLSPGIFALTRMLGKPMRCVRCCLKVSTYVNQVVSYVPTKTIWLQNAFKIKKCLVSCNWNILIWGMLFPTPLSLCTTDFSPRSYEFPLANFLSNNYLSGFLSGVINLFLLAFHMAEILTFDGYLNYNNMLVTKQFNS